MQSRLEVRLRPSSTLKTFYFALLLLLAGMCIAADVSWPVRAAALIYLGWAGHSTYRCWVQLTASRSIIAIRLDEAGWWLETLNGGWCQVALRESASVMTAGVIALEFATLEPRFFQRRTFHTLILADSAAAEQRRRLRLSLRALADS